jgi:CHAT domain-containing protein
VWALLVALLLPRTVQAEGEGAEALLDESARAALEAGSDAEAQRRNLRRQQSDGWVEVHQLCLYGAFDVARQVALAAHEAERPALLAQVKAHRAIGPRQGELQRLWVPVGEAREEEEAREALRLLDAFGTSPSPISRIRMLGARAEALRYLGQDREAAQLLDRAATAAQELGWRRRAHGAWRAAGQLWQRAGGLEQALKAYRLAFALAEGYGDPIAAAEDLNLVPDVLRSMGRLEEALEAAKAVPLRYEALGNQRMVGWTQNAVAAAYRRLGMLREAMEWIEKALVNANASGCPYCRAGAYGERGVVQRLLGRFAEAAESHEAEYDLMKGEGMLVAMAKARQRLGDVALMRGEYRRALRSYEEAAVHAVEGLANDMDDARESAEAAIQGQAQVRTAMGQYEEALEAYEGNLVSQEQRGDQPQIAATLSNMGRVLVALGQHERATEVLERCVAMTRAMKDRHGTARALVVLAEARAGRGQTEEALRLADEALDMARALDDPHTAAGAGLTKAAALAGVGRDEEAADLITLTLYRLAGVDAPDYRATGLELLARVELRRGQVADALRAAREGLREGNRLAGALGTEESAGTRNRLRGLYAVGLEAAVTAGSTSDAAFFLESARAGVLLESLRARDALLSTLLPEELQQALTDAREGDRAASAAYEAARQRGKRAALRQARQARDTARLHLQRTVERVQSEAKALAQITFPTPDSLEQIQGSVQPDEVLLLYGATTRDTVCLLVRRDSARLVTLGTHAEMLERVRAIRLPERPHVEPAGAAALKAFLIDPLELDETEQLLISPYDEMSVVPFAILLPDRELAFVGSGTTYRLLFEQNRERGGAHGCSVLGMGDPQYPLGGSLVALPRTREEVTSIADVKLLGDHANEGAFRGALLQKPRWCAIHIACHGLVDEEHPMFSCLALTPTANDDGQLTALEVFQLHLPAELVVLSACDTARGKLYAAEGVVGLTRAFTFAGAPRVISSLWQVDDAATQALMLKFYEYWNPKGTGVEPIGAGAALQKAQAYVRSQAKWEHPYYWAAWVLWGLPR